MGCGKSSVGRKLATLLGGMCADGRAEERVHYIDLDDYIVAREGRRISEIFADGGEAAFREIETQCLCEVLDRAEEKTAPDILVLSLGGGTLIKNSEIIGRRTFCVYLKCSVDTMVRRLSGNTSKRPLLASEPETELRARVESLLNERRELYESTAHLSIVTDGFSVYESAAGIIEMINKR